VAIFSSTKSFDGTDSLLACARIPQVHPPEELHFLIAVFSLASKATRAKWLSRQESDSENEDVLCADGTRCQASGLHWADAKDVSAKVASSAF
jgi:hypothetical protein